MEAFSVLLALHAAPPTGERLGTELRARGWRVVVSRNQADTWALARDGSHDAVILAPVGPAADGPELASLLEVAAHPGGPALLVLTREPASLEDHAEHLDDFLAPDDDLDLVCRRLRFSIARKRALARLHEDRESLREATTTDYKTGLHNDRYFSERCRIDSARSARDGRCLGLLMIDLDNFKALNESCGHPFADKVLTRLGKLLRVGLRPFDTAARIGGDEFGVLLPDTGLRDAGRIAERLRSEIEGMLFEDEGLTAKVTVTIGVTSWDPLRGGSFEAAVEAADAMLRSAKRKGRNRVLLAEQPGGDALAMGQPFTG